MMSVKKPVDKKGVIAVLLVMLMLTGILFSYHFITENAHHDCTGENCPVCAQLEEAVQFVQSVKHVPVLSFFVAVLFLFTERTACEAKHILINRTLISLKTELLN